MKKKLIPVGIAALVLLLAACGTAIEPPVVVPGGDAARGQSALLGYGCNACHAIPGVYGTTATVGPSLAEFARRRFAAGELENTPDNVIKWIMAPQSVEPGTAMPNLGVNEATARDMAAYLYTLK